MTVNEAQQRLDACETQVQLSYQDLKEKVKRVSTNTTESASKEKKRLTFAPLLLCVVGLLLLHGPWYIGVLFIALGIFISYKLHSSAKKKCNSIKALQQDLNIALQNYTDI